MAADDIDALVTSDDETWTTAGGFDYTDRIALGFAKRAGRGNPVVLSQMEVLWLCEGYGRLRKEQG